MRSSHRSAGCNGRSVTFGYDSTGMGAGRCRRRCVGFGVACLKCDDHEPARRQGQYAACRPVSPQPASQCRDGLGRAGSGIRVARPPPGSGHRRRNRRPAHRMRRALRPGAGPRSVRFGRLDCNLHWLVAAMVLGGPLGLVGAVTRRLDPWGATARLIVPIGAVLEPFVHGWFTTPAILPWPNRVADLVSGLTLLTVGAAGCLHVLVAGRRRQATHGQRATAEQ